jgi:serine/threonine-protein kinase
MRTPLSIESVLADRYSILKLLYLGTVGWVYLAIDQTTNKFYVLEETATDLNELQALFTKLNFRYFAQYQDAIVEFDRVYLIRNYIEGRSYRELLEQQRIFSEAEVMRFLKQVLLILRSLHRLKIAHHSISLNSIIQREDGSLILTEFTQARLAETFDTDLYYLAVIAIVLLTGCEPKDLYNEATGQWEWQDWESVNPRIVKVLDRMLSDQQRYSSAAEVMQALFAPDQKDIASIVFTFVLIGLAAISAYRLINHLSNLQPALVTPPIAINAELTPPETIAQRSKRLKVSQQLLSQITEETSQSSEAILKQLELLSQEARSGMGTYKRVNYDAWQSKRLSNISDRAIETLTDAQFVALFPDQQGKILNPRTFGQVWYAIALDQIKQAKAELISSQVSGTLKQGAGRIYRSQFKQGQTVKLSLNAPAGRIAIWMFSAETSLIKNSNQSTWSGKIQRSGIYELIVAPTSTTPVQYELQIDTAAH